MIFKKSRYATSELYRDGRTGTSYVGFKNTNISPASTDVIYQFKGGDTLDSLANTFYGSPKFKWIILYANPQYYTEFDIKYGDSVIIPLKERIIK